MTADNKVIKVKDTGDVGVLFMVTAITPVIVIFIAIELDLSRLLIGVLSLTIFALAFYLIIRTLIRREDIYKIIADKNTVTIKDKTYNWKEIEEIETYSRRPIGHRMSKVYIKFNMKTNESVVLNATNYDIWYEDLKKELISLKTSNNKENAPSRGVNKN